MAGTLGDRGDAAVERRPLQQYLERPAGHGYGPDRHKAGSLIYQVVKAGGTAIRG